MVLKSVLSQKFLKSKAQIVLNLFLGFGEYWKDWEYWDGWEYWECWEYLEGWEYWDG